MNSIPSLPKFEAASNARRLASLKRRRKVWLDLHLWLGLGLGLFLAICGLTGSVLVFWQEIDAAMNPQIYRVPTQPAGLPLPLDDIVGAARRYAPPGWESAYADAPKGSAANFVFHFYYGQSASPPPREAESLNVAVDPYTGAVVGERVFYHSWNPLKHCFVGFFFKLHYALFLGATGVTLVGALAVLFTISALTGLILWWPLDGKWLRVLTIKPRASTERFIHDLHQSAGFYSLLVLLAVLISGIYFNLPDQFRWLVGCFSPLTTEPAGSAAVTLKPRLDDILADARREFPGGEPQYYSFTNDAEAKFTVCYRDVPELWRYVLSSRCLTLDVNDGRLLQVSDPAHGTGGDVFLQWQWPLHSGRAFGWTGRILVFVAGLVCPLLFVTGFLRWRQKRRAKALRPHYR